MNLVATISIYAGGPGSGCNPSVGKCGRNAGVQGFIVVGKNSVEKDAVVKFLKTIPEDHLYGLTVKVDSRYNSYGYGKYEHKEKLITLFTGKSSKTDLDETVAHEVGHFVADKIDPQGSMFNHPPTDEVFAERYASAVRSNIADEKINNYLREGGLTTFKKR